MDGCEEILEGKRLGEAGISLHLGTDLPYPARRGDGDNPWRPHCVLPNVPGDLRTRHPRQLLIQDDISQRDRPARCRNRESPPRTRPAPVPQEDTVSYDSWEKRASSTVTRRSAVYPLARAARMVIWRCSKIRGIFQRRSILPQGIVR
jgi:hypothetical protein